MTLLQFVDGVLVFLVLEILVLMALHARTGRGLTSSQLLPMMAAGGFILLALRLALADSSPMLVVACLAASGIAHALDVKGRWPRHAGSR